MKIILVKFLVIYYTLGTMFLPMGDFSSVGDLQKMYEHCKATEDKDMTVMDFITDHLVNIDRLFDQHQNGDEQKPHKPYEYSIHNSISQFIQEFRYFDFKNLKPFVTSYQIKISNYKNTLYSYQLISSIFRPPIFATKFF
ncbi:MAG: hypothetical protein WCJ62_09170 [Flavobacterium sp.]